MTQETYRTCLFLPPQTLQMLIESSIHSLHEGAQSLKCPHLMGAIEARLPCWVLTYWYEVIAI